MSKAATAQQAPATAHPRRNVWVFIAQALFAGLLLAAVAGGLWTITREQTRLAEAPAMLAGFSLVDVTTGETALLSMERLHGKDIGLKDGWIAAYQDGGVLWVGEAESPAAAERLTAEMTERIQDGNPMFRHLGMEDLGAVTAHKVTDGMSLHYYYQLGKKVIWISTPQESGPQFVQEAIAVLSGD